MMGNHYIWYAPIPNMASAQVLINKDNMLRYAGIYITDCLSSQPQHIVVGGG